MRMRIEIGMVIVFTVLAGLVPTDLAAQGTGARLDVFDEWNLQASRSIIVVAGPVAPPVSAIQLAIVQLAVYNAVVAISGGYAPYRAAAPATPGGSVEAAVATAAHDVLVALYAGQKAELDTKLAQSLATIPEGRAKMMGMAVGSRAAQDILRDRANDGRFSAVPYTPGTLVGMWEPSPPGFGAYAFPWIGQVKPFALRLPSQFRPLGPPPMESAKYAEEFNEVKRLGSIRSTVRTAEQRETGMFWTDQTAAQWNRALGVLARERGLSIPAKARLFAMVWTSVGDAAIGCWNAKSYYSFWRPIAAIRRAADDGNPATEADPTWEPLLATAAHPEYPSGHSCFTSATVAAIETFFGTRDVPVAVDSLVTNTTRRFARAEDALKEVIEARIYIGYHFRSADVDGATLGRSTARYILARYFLPAP